MPDYVIALIGAVVALVAVATVLAGRRQRARSGEFDSDSLGFIGAILNGLFIVVLAFYTVIVWEEASAAEDHAAAEASALADAYWHLGVAPEPQRDRLRGLVRAYTAEVVEHEWPMLAEGEGAAHAEELLFSLRSGIGSLPLTPDLVKTARDRAAEQIREVIDKRRARIDQAGGLSPTGELTLFGTLGGAVAVIVFPLLAGFSASIRHVVLISLMAGVLAFTCYVVSEITQPFDGWIKVEPDAFRTVADEFQRIP